MAHAVLLSCDHISGTPDAVGYRVRRKIYVEGRVAEPRVSRAHYHESSNRISDIYRSRFREAFCSLGR